MGDTNFQGMSERDILIIVYESVKDLKTKNESTEKRLSQVEMDLLQHKTEIGTQIKIYLALATTVATGAVSVFQKIFLH